MHPYQQVIQDVKKVNRQAALIMARKLPLLKMRGKMPGSYGPREDQINPKLGASFYWITTPQGHAYWSEIAEKI